LAAACLESDVHLIGSGVVRLSTRVDCRSAG
jgi:hypothetical protein